MLISPVCVRELAEASILYSELDSRHWAEGDTTIVYDYDLKGAQTKKTVTSTSTTLVLETEVYTYNLSGRLVKVVKSYTDDYEDEIVETTEYDYNPQGIRVQSYYFKTVDGGNPQGEETKSFLIDSSNHTGYAQVIEEWLSGGSVPSVTYTIGDDVLSQYSQTRGPEQLLYDGHGSTRQITSYDGQISNNYSYDAYGVMLGGNPTSPAGTNLLYTGEWYDSESQNYYLRARYYNSATGRFNRTDPFAGNYQDPQSLHKYLYVHNNPINAIDPSGRFSLLTDFSISSAIQTTLRGIKIAAVFAAKHKFATSVGAKLVLLGVALALFALAGYSYFGAPTIVAFIDMNLNKETLHNPSIDNIREKIEKFKETGTKLSTFFIRSHGSSEMMYWDDIFMTVSGRNQLLLQNINNINNPFNLGEALQEVLVNDGTVILGGCGAGRGENSLGEKVSLVLPSRTVIAGRGPTSAQVPLTEGSFFGSNIFKDGELKGTDWGFYGY